jgi:hypothetical protein
MYLYGRGRCFYLKRHPDGFETKFLAPLVVPLAYSVALASDLVAQNWRAPRAMLLALIHLSAIAALIAGEARRQGSSLLVWFYATWVVWLTHLIYGVGMVNELPRRRDRFTI